ncbi:aldolase [Trametes coccinea BRFM310]|uniref:2-isopropylmalate synthase n=1 Tax=Trametes coccinea (strain BRFM310) TaxID=1353009 RepID=A0A1Y2I8V2_TRAC3|nr:aldolase [Trametes coccinea BRFM310]
MTVQQKRTFFRHLVQCGFKEIEVAFPAASETEFSFVRSLIEDGEVPDDVWMQVLTPARAELIHRTFESIAGARQVIFMLFHAAAPCFREVVFGGKSKAEIIDLATSHTRIVRALADEYSAKYGTKFRFLYGVEAFSQTEPEFVVELCTKVKEAWGRAGTRFEERIMFNLPSTVEISPPTHYADQIEYFCTHMGNRDEMIVSLHTHNDRGTAVAASELGLMAGADRIEGCLFGNGERCGNVDLITLALNLYTQGVPCGLDFSDMPRTIDVYTQCTGMPVPARHPYAGELVFTAFSGSHQDGIKKGFEAQAARHAQAEREGKRKMWMVPYLPLDPEDVGRVYEAVIRVNAQSGKGGTAFIIRRHLHVDLPRAVQQEFYGVVQRRTDREARELSADEIVRTFKAYYHLDDRASRGTLTLDSFAVKETSSERVPMATFQGQMSDDGKTFSLRGEGSTPLAAFLDAVQSRTGLEYSVIEMHQRASLNPTSGEIVSFILLADPNSRGVTSNGDVHHNAPCWGVGIDADRTRSLIRAALSAINRLHRASTDTLHETLNGSTREEVLRILADQYALSVPIPYAMQDALAEICAAGDVAGISPDQAAAWFVARFYHRAPRNGDALKAALLGFSIARVPSSSGPGEAAKRMRVQATVLLHGREQPVEGTGSDAVNSLLTGLSGLVGFVALRGMEVRPVTEPARGRQNVAFVQVESEKHQVGWGVGLDEDLTTAMLQAALIAAVNCCEH